MGWSIRILAAILVIAITAITAVTAEPLGAEEAEVIETSRYNDSTTPDTVDAEAGNLTELSITGTAVTRTWQGFYGNVTGSLILADSSGNNFYDWNISTPSGQIYASRNDSVVWTGITCLTGARLEDEETFLNRSPTDPDSVTNTFADTNHPAFQVGTESISGCPTTQAYGDGGSQDGEFWQVLLDDTNANTVYTTIIEESVVQGFNDRPWHFQLLVGENGHTGPGTTPYYFYVELS